MSILTVTQKGTTLRYDTQTHCFAVERGGALWQTSAAPYVEYKTNEGVKPRPWIEAPGDYAQTPLTLAQRIETRPWKTGLGEGFLTRYEGIPGTGMTLETLLWVDNCRGELYGEILPYEDPKNEWHRIMFPAAFDFPQRRSDWYCLINARQGLLVPNDDPYTDSRTSGQYYATGQYMPWFGQVKERDAYIAIALTPWDGGYIMHGGPEDPKQLGQYWLPSLGRLAYRRVVRYTFLQGDYNDLCQVYRRYAKETGLLVTLGEKAVRNPLVARLAGCAIVHEKTYWHPSPESFYYRPEAAESLSATFDERAAQLRALRDRWGLDRIHFHLDGWGVDGYDNRHPDYLPPCAQAGGYEGMARLSRTLEELGYLFATHDQYRDYYHNAPSYDREMAVRDAKGAVYSHSFWPGGHQDFLCSSQAPGYVRRNYEELAAHGVGLTGTYLDVFSAGETDECDHDRHRVTRRECIGYRKACMDYAMAHGLVVSSEEGHDCYLQTMALCHHAPCNAPLRTVRGKGIAVPLFNLVYHDCLVQPVHGPLGVDGFDEALEDTGRDVLLEEALLMGEPVYLPIAPDEEAVARCRKAARLHRAVAFEQMLRHEFVTPHVRRTVFANGVTVTLDTQKGDIQIEGLA